MRNCWQPHLFDGLGPSFGLRLAEVAPDTFDGGYSVNVNAQERSSQTAGGHEARKPLLLRDLGPNITTRYGLLFLRDFSNESSESSFGSTGRRDGT